MQVFSIIVLVFLLLILVFLGIYLLVMHIFFQRVFGRKDTKRRLDEKSGIVENYKIDLNWINEHKFQTLKLISDDELKLNAYYLQNEGDKVAVLVHGYGSCWKEMASFARFFFEMGYSVLITENRGHGKSEGKIAMGMLEKDDIISWTNLLVSKNPNYKIVLFGVSMGGASVCFTADKELSKNVVCIISDSAYKNVYDELYLVYNPKNNKFKKKVFDSFTTYMNRAYLMDLRKGDVGDALKKTKVPVMIIHGKDDSFVPVQNAYNLFEKLPKFKGELYVVDGAGHAMSYAKNPYRYEQKIKEFLKKWGM